MPLLLASWNVAGWETALKYVNEHYGSLEAYLDRHQVDILCLQEVKVTRQKLSANAAGLGAHSLAGWVSFWSCSKKGFNGVTRRGARADRRAEAGASGATVAGYIRRHVRM